MAVTRPCSLTGCAQVPVLASCRSQVLEVSEGDYVVGCCHRPRAVFWFGGDGGGRAAWCHGWVSAPALVGGLAGDAEPEADLGQE